MRVLLFASNHRAPSCSRSQSVEPAADGDAHGAKTGAEAGPAPGDHVAGPNGQMVAHAQSARDRKRRRDLQNRRVAGAGDLDVYVPPPPPPELHLLFLEPLLQVRSETHSPVAPWSCV